MSRITPVARISPPNGGRFFTLHPEPKSKRNLHTPPIKMNVHRTLLPQELLRCLERSSSSPPAGEFNYLRKRGQPRSRATKI